MTTQSTRSPWKRTSLLFLGHFLNDGFASFYAPLLPLLIDRLDLSLTFAGLLATVRIVSNSLIQPGLGYIVDRAQRPFLVILGPILTVTAMAFIGRAERVWQLLVIMLVAGLGTAMFHPAGAALAVAGNANRRGLIMAFFSSGGTLGGAVAPLAIVSFTHTFGLARTPWLLLAGLAIVLAFALPLRRELPDPVRTSHEAFRFRTLPPRLIRLWFVIVLSAMCNTAFSSFLAVLVVERGGSAFAGGATISVFLLLGAIAGFLAGHLSDRFGRKAVIIASLALTTPLLLAFLHGPVSLLLPFVAGAGFFGFSSVPVGVVAAQEMLPGRTGLVSGLVMGLAWGVGGLALTPIGWLADHLGIVPVMSVVALLPIAAALLMAFDKESVSKPLRESLSTVQESNEAR